MLSQAERSARNALAWSHLSLVLSFIEVNDDTGIADSVFSMLSNIHQMAGLPSPLIENENLDTPCLHSKQEFLRYLMDLSRDEILRALTKSPVMVIFVSPADEQPTNRRHCIPWSGTPQDFQRYYEAEVARFCKQT
jgi:hypothetical protein